MRRSWWLVAVAVLLLPLGARPAAAEEGTLLKWDQPPVLRSDENRWDGENFPSAIDWRVVPDEFPPPIPAFPPQANWSAADDFVSDGRPILTVRWWGSYFHPSDQPVFDPGSGSYAETVAEAYLISFFTDQAADPESGQAFSQPGDLLGAYFAPESAIAIVPTGLNDWAGHQVWEYQANLSDTHLFHASEIATALSFNEVAEVSYWISIAALNGVEYDANSGQIVPLTTVADPLATLPFWGWLTRPHAFADDPTVGNLFMPAGQGGVPIWLFDQWAPLQPQQQARPDLTFQLLTDVVPEPGALLLLGVGGVAAVWRGRRGV